MAKYVIFDPTICTKTDLKQFGVPSDKMFNLSHLTNPDKYDDDDNVKIIPGNSYLMIGPECYKYVNSHFHLGLRKVTYYQVCEIPKVSTRDGINFSFIAKVFNTTKFKPRLEFFLSDNFTKKLRDLPEENKIITKDLRIGIKWLRNWIDGVWHEKKLDEWFGLDYETADVTNLNHKDICGVGISSLTRAIFIDFRFPKSKEEWQEFSKVYIDFCMKFRDRLWVYNAKFEFDRTNETFGVYVDFQDAGAMNIVDARQMIYYSLKFTAQYYTGVASWDDDFAFFEDYLHKEIFKNYKNLDELLADKDRVERMKTHFIDEDDFNEWVEIAKIIPEYWGDRFWNQTSRNLGKYCILDSYYTLMIAAVQWPKYPELANELTCDNLRLGSQLMATGCFLDIDKRNELRKINFKYQCYAAFKLLSAYYTLKQQEVDNSFIDKLSPICKKLILKGLNPVKGQEFWKDSAYLLEDSNSETLVNEYNAVYYLGEVVGNKLINFGRRYKKLISNFTRSKKMASDLDRYRHMLYTDEDKNLIAKYASELRKINSNKVYEKRLNIMKSSPLYYKQFDEVGTNDLFEFGGKERSLEQIADILINTKRNRSGWYKLGAPIDQKAIRDFFLNIMDGYPCCFSFNLYSRLKYIKSLLPDIDHNDPKVIYRAYRDEVSYLNNLIKCWFEKFDNDGTITQLSEKDVESLRNYKKLSSPNNIKNYINFILNELEDPKYADKNPDKVPEPFESGYRKKNLGDVFYDRLVNCAHSGFGRWSKCDSYQDIKRKTNQFGFEYDIETPYEIISTCIKSIYMFSIYNKEITYLDGIFYQDKRKVSIIDKDLRVKTDPNGDYYHIKTKFNMCRLKTKRSSSGFHTIPHASCIKGIIKAPKGYAMSYFDVSQAEPRTAAYLIDKAKMRDCYESGQDLYHLTAALMHNCTYEEWVKRPEAKIYRVIFKVCLLGLLYGMGPETLAGRIGTDTETAKVYIKALFDTFPELKAGIELRKQYPLDHNRECMTFWGDKMYTDVGNDATKKRYGINYPVQGNTSIALTAGFYNVVRQCEDANLNIRPVLAIHDALVCYFPIQQLWDLNAFYTHNFTDYLYEKTKVKYKFSVNYGTDYFNMCEITNIDSENIQMEGSNLSIKQLLNELDDIGFKYEIISQEMPIEPDCQVLIKKYNKEYGKNSSYAEDSTSNKVIVKRISECDYNIPKYN